MTCGHYVFQPDGPVVLLFPVSPSLVIYGESTRKKQFASEGLGIADLSGIGLVETSNRQVCRFGYQTIFAQKAGQERLIQEHAQLSAVAHFDRVVLVKGKGMHFRWSLESESASRNGADDKDYQQHDS